MVIQCLVNGDDVVTSWRAGVGEFYPAWLVLAEALVSLDTCPRFNSVSCKWKILGSGQVMDCPVMDSWAAHCSILFAAPLSANNKRTSHIHIWRHMADTAHLSRHMTYHCCCPSTFIHSGPSFHIIIHADCRSNKQMCCNMPLRGDENPYVYLSQNM